MFQENYVVETLRSNIVALKKNWYGWVERLKPLILEKFKKYKISLERFQDQHYKMIVEISQECIGSPDGTAAATALKTHDRIKKAYKELSKYVDVAAEAKSFIDIDFSDTLLLTERA